MVDAVDAADKQAVEQHVAAGADINETDDFVRVASALFTVPATQPLVVCCAAELRCGISSVQMGWTPLHHAVLLKDESQRVAMINMLLGMGSFWVRAN